jgi:hypothetical protein
MPHGYAAFHGREVLRIVGPQGSRVNKDIHVAQVFGIVADVNLCPPGAQRINSRRRANIRTRNNNAPVEEHVSQGVHARTASAHEVGSCHTLRHKDRVIGLNHFLSPLEDLAERESHH